MEKGIYTQNNRKSNKPLMEKRRRARINTSLEQLKGLVLEALKKDTSRYSKLEKADILEMTVKHLKTIQRHQMAVAMSTDPTVIVKYRTGFNECANEVTRYLSNTDGLDTNVKTRLLNFTNGLQRSNSEIQPPYVPLPSQYTNTNPKNLMGLPWGQMYVPAVQPGNEASHGIPLQKTVIPANKNFIYGDNNNHNISRDIKLETVEDLMSSNFDLSYSNSVPSTGFHGCLGYKQEDCLNNSSTSYGKTYKSQDHHQRKCTQENNNENELSRNYYNSHNNETEKPKISSSNLNIKQEPVWRPW